MCQCCPSSPSLRRPAVFPRREMFNTFNMGIGMTVVVAREEAEKAMEVLASRWGTARSSGRNCRRRRGCHPMVKTKIAVLVPGGGTNLQAPAGRPEGRGC